MYDQLTSSIICERSPTICMLPFPNLSKIYKVHTCKPASSASDRCLSLANSPRNALRRLRRLRKPSSGRSFAIPLPSRPGPRLSSRSMTGLRAEPHEKALSRGSPGEAPSVLVQRLAHSFCMHQAADEHTFCRLELSGSGMLERRLGLLLSSRLTGRRRRRSPISLLPLLGARRCSPRRPCSSTSPPIFAWRRLIAVSASSTTPLMPWSAPLRRLLRFCSSTTRRRSWGHRLAGFSGPIKSWSRRLSLRCWCVNVVVSNRIQTYRALV